jgi:hypothetical protein
VIAESQIVPLEQDKTITIQNWLRGQSNVLVVQADLVCILILYIQSEASSYYLSCKETRLRPVLRSTNSDARPIETQTSAGTVDSGIVRRIVIWPLSMVNIPCVGLLGEVLPHGARIAHYKNGSIS